MTDNTSFNQQIQISAESRQKTKEVKSFWSKVETPRTWGECWEWTAAKRSDGYGAFRSGGKLTGAHRLAYEQVIGKIPIGKQIDHLCRNRVCVNPYHLQPVTQKENILRGESPSAKQARQTHCKHGHPLSGDNISIVRNGRGRNCKTCMVLWREASA